MSEHTLLKAEMGEQLVWNRLIRNPEDKSCTLSYRFLINRTMSLEEINKAIYGFLLHHKELTYCFYEHEGTLYKRLQQPSLVPVSEIDEFFPVRKMLFNEAFNPLYCFQWQAKGKGGCLYVHLSHLIIDGSGFALLVSELEAALLGRSARSDNLSLMPELANEDKDDYWRRYLQEQSLYQPIPCLEQYEPKDVIHCEQVISQEIVQQFSVYKKNNKATVFHLLSTALALTLYHYLKDEETENTIRLAYYVNANKHRVGFGCAMNLLPLFVPCTDENTLADILQHVINTRTEQRSRQNFAIADLLHYLDPVKNNKNSLMNVVINESPGLLAQANPAFFSEVKGFENHSAATTLSLIYAFDGEILKVRFESDQGALLHELLKQLGDHFEQALKCLLTQPHTRLGELLLKTSMEPVSQGACIVHEQGLLWHTFAEQMQNHTSRIAIRDEHHTLSYNTLYSALGSLYGCLAKQQEKQLSKGVALFLTRTAMLPVAMLGAINARVTFIPIAENLPEAARRSIIDETQLSIILVDNNSERLLTAAERERLQVINLETLSPCLENMPVFPPLIKNDIAYILFTSGSTGKPKGVMITYDNLTNFLYSIAANPGFTPQDTLLAITSISFDIAINELLLPLFCGGSVFVAANYVRSCHKSLRALLRQHHITVLQATPSTVGLLMQNNWHWHNKHQLRLWIGGEALTKDLVRFCKRQNIAVYNMYGPTETTIWVSASLIQSDECLSIGTPLVNTSLLVLDKQGNASALGIPGELVVEGQLVGKGYINHSTTSFKQNDKGIKRYHTGDKVIALARNRIIYIKRYDDQIKLRGYRIELEEINTYLRAAIPHFSGLTLAVEYPEPHLCVYFTAPADLNSVLLNEQLKKVLPEYKIPQRYRLLKNIPLNNNGKVDRKKLLAGDFDELFGGQKSTNDLPPVSGAMEQKIAQLILKHFAVTIDDPGRSLLDYGFNSLSFNHLSLLCEQELDLAIHSHQFYHLNTISKLADYSRANTIIIAEPSPTRQEQHVTHTPIAIIGYDALLPGNKNPEQFWTALMNQECLISENKRPWLNGNERAGYLDDIEYFDRKFFNLSPIEVMHLDFRQRLLLQCAVRTIEHAAMPAEQLAQKRVACFIAATGMDSLLVSAKQGIPAHPYSLSGNSLSMLANRLSFYFNWQGPSVTVDTACSGSLAALARAVECLSLGKAESCFVGSANLIIDDEFSKALQAGRFLSPQYHCASFSEQADGYVRGEGILGFLLKPLKQAQKDGDIIHAIIHGVGENHGGRAASLTSPSQHAQTALLQTAYTPSLMEQLSYIETHGTGTKLGDPIEIDALKEFENDSLATNRQNAIYLGALKQNIGHLEASAGFASLLKVILAMKHDYLPANPYRYALNSLIDLEHSKLKLLTEPVAWDDKFQIAGVSSFGFGGSNAHVVLAGYKEDVLVTAHPEQNVPFLLSAKSMTALRSRIISLLHDLNSGSSLNDIAYSLALGRTYFEYRTAVVAQNREELYKKLRALLNSDDLRNVVDENHLFGPELKRYLAGEDVDWSVFFNALSCKRIALSPYVFDTEYCLHERFPRFASRSVDLMEEVRWSKINERQQNIILTQNHPFLAEHQVYYNNVLPGVSYVDFLLNLLAQQDSQQTFICLENICWLQPSVCSKDTLALTLELGAQSNSFSFQFYNEENQRLVTGEYTLQKRNYESLYSWFDGARNTLKQPGLAAVSKEVIYKKFSQLGIDYGPYFQGISSITVHDSLALTSLSINPLGSCTALLDASFQSGMAIDLSETQAGLMPFSLGKMIVFNTDTLRTMHKSKVYTFKNSPFRTNLIICDEEEQPVAVLIDLGVKPTLLK